MLKRGRPKKTLKRKEIEPDQEEDFVEDYSSQEELEKIQEENKALRLQLQLQDEGEWKRLMLGQMMEMNKHFNLQARQLNSIALILQEFLDREIEEEK